MQSFWDRAKSIWQLYDLHGTKDLIMICPGTSVDCDNPGCRRGGCQGRPPELPLFHAARATQPPENPDCPAFAPLAATGQIQPVAA